VISWFSNFAFTNGSTCTAYSPGKWYAPQIDNPAYKGVWAPAKIANPNFYEDKTPLAAGLYPKP
jgi:hypothetical protein